MENFFIDESFYSELEDFLEEMEWDEELAKALPDDWSIVATESYLEPMFVLSAHWITERIDEERFPESETEEYKLANALSLIDYEKVNALIPKLYYGTGKKFTITKNDLLEELK